MQLSKKCFNVTNWDNEVQMKRSNIGYARTFYLQIITINFIPFNLVKFEEWSVFDVEVSILEKNNFPGSDPTTVQRDQDVTARKNQLILPLKWNEYVNEFAMFLNQIRQF